MRPKAVLSSGCGLLAAASVVFSALPCGAVAQRQTLGRALANLHVVEGKILSSRRSDFYSDADGNVFDVQMGVWRVYCGEGVTDETKFTALVGQGRPHAAAWPQTEIAILDLKAADHRIWLVGAEGGVVQRRLVDDAVEVGAVEQVGADLQVVRVLVE